MMRRKSSGGERPAKLRRRASELAPEDAPERSHIAHADIRQDLVDAAPALGEETPHRLDALQLQVLPRRDAIGFAELAMEGAQAHVAVPGHLRGRRRAL